MTELSQQIEFLKRQDKTGKTIFAKADPGTGEVTIHRYIPLIGPKKETPCLPKLLTLYTFNPESASTSTGIDLSQVVIQIPEDDSLDNSQHGFEAFMTDLVATHIKAADTWLGAVKREEKANTAKNETKCVVEEKPKDVEGSASDNEDEQSDKEEEEWKPPTLAEQCQRMYREINDVYKRRNAAAAEGKWRYWEQFAVAEALMRVRHIWWMDISGR